MTTLPIGPLDRFVDGEAAQVEAGGRVLAVVRLGDDVYVLGDRCTHADVSLAEGEVDPDARTIECWRHGSAFSLESGEPDALPATRPTPVYDATVVDGEVLVTVTVDESAGA